MYDELVRRLRRCEKFRCRECEYEQVIGCRAKLNEEAADAIETMCEIVATAHGELANVIENYEESKPRWIPVTERLP